MLNCDDGRSLVSRRIIAKLLVVSEMTVYRTLEPKACDTATHTYLYDAAEAQARWPARPPDDANRDGWDS
jgi:hypothetical protein